MDFSFTETQNDAAELAATIFKNECTPERLKAADPGRFDQALWAKLGDAGLLALTSFVSPYRKDRDAARKIHEQNKAGAIPFVEVYVNTPIECCETRDPKGLYKQARDAVAAGKGMGFTGVDDPYEPPTKPELTFDASKHSVEEGVAIVLNYLGERKLIG